MKITEERMNEVLPPNILESELELATKKVLAALCDWYLNSLAKESGIVIISNKELAAIACVGGTQLQKALRQLQDYNLVDRIIGTGLGNASQYRINFKQMMKPLKRKTFAELFNLELEEPESSEKPISTIVQYRIVQSSSDKPIPSYNSSGKFIAEEGIPEGAGLDEDLFGTKTYIKNRNTKKDILKDDSNKELEREYEEGMTEPNSKNENEGKEDPSEYQDNEIPTGDNQEPSGEGLHEGGGHAAGSSPLQPQEEEPRPTSLSELQKHFLKRFRQEFKEKIPESDSDIEHSRERLYQELEGFSDISDYRLVGYMIKNACEKENDRLMERMLNSP